MRIWEELVKKLLKKYFSESNTTQGKTEISSFHRFLTSHSLKQLHIFIDDLQPHSKQLLVVSAGEKIKLKTPNEAMKLIENTTVNDHVIFHDRVYMHTNKSFIELTSQDALLTQSKLLAN